MGLDISFAEDVRNALVAADEASSSTARVCAALGGDQATLRAYLEGYRGPDHRGPGLRSLANYHRWSARNPGSRSHDGR
jgi:hypothetical protein